MPMPNSITYPINFVNRRGIPLIESGSAAIVADTAVSLSIANNAFRFLEPRGVFLFRLTQSIPEAGAALPVVLSWTGFSGQVRTQALTLAGGAAVTGEQLSSIGVYFVYYDKDTNLLQLMNVAQAATTTNSNNNG